MGKVTRGTLLATLKELKKHKRPKPATTAVAVQAICGGGVQSNKAADLKAVVERRRAMLSSSSGDYTASVEYRKCEEEFNAFLLKYKQQKPNSSSAREDGDDS